MISKVFCNSVKKKIQSICSSISVVRPSMNYHFGTFMLKTIQTQELTKDPWKPHSTLSNWRGKKTNLCNGW